MDGYKEVMFYDKNGLDTRCRICPHYCQIKPGSIGICKNKINIDGKLYLKSYAKPCALNIDPIEKKPLYHFMPQSRTLSLALTGCNFRCLNCQNDSISQALPEETAHYKAGHEAIIGTALENKCSSISYTYTEPAIYYEYMYDIALEARKFKLKNVMVSNGYINKEPLEALIPYLDAINIDLKTFDAAQHFKLTGGHLKHVLDTVLLLKNTSVWIEFTHLVIPGWNDDAKSLKKMCAWLIDNGLHCFPLHLSRFSPRYKLSHLSPTPLDTMETAVSIAKDAGIKYVYAGNVPQQYNENTYCPSCNRVLVKRNAFIASEINIIKNRCKFCNQLIEGIWG